MQTIVAFLDPLKLHCNIMGYHMNLDIPGVKSCSQQVSSIHTYDEAEASHFSISISIFPCTSK